jgi:hypothetical protein
MEHPGRCGSSSRMWISRRLTASMSAMCKAFAETRPESVLGWCLPSLSAENQVSYPHGEGNSDPGLWGAATAILWCLVRSAKAFPISPSSAVASVYFLGSLNTIHAYTQQRGAVAKALSGHDLCGQVLSVPIMRG